jgi:hypothetical protein
VSFQEFLGHVHNMAIGGGLLAGNDWLAIVARLAHPPS